MLTAKAQRAVDGKAPVKRNRFIKLSGAAKSVNRDLEVTGPRELSMIETDLIGRPSVVTSN